MTFWFLLVAGLVGASVLLTAIVGAIVEPSDEEQEAQELLDAIWRERERQDRRRDELNAVVRVSERGQEGVMEKTRKRAPGLTDTTTEERKAMNLVAYDPGEQALDLNKSEKIRTTALLMAINYVRETICHDAAMYQALRADGKRLVPATTPFVLQSAIEFEAFLLGRYTAAGQVAMDAVPNTPLESPDTEDAVSPPGEQIYR